MKSAFRAATQTAERAIFNIADRASECLAANRLRLEQAGFALFMFGLIALLVLLYGNVPIV